MFSVHHVSLSVNKLNETIEFYKKFGFKLKREYHDEAVDIVHLTLKNSVLELFHHKNSNPLPEHCKNHSTDLQFIGTKHLGIGVKDINKAKKFIEVNNLFDGEIIVKPGRLKKPYFFVKDPNGIWVEIIEK